jgi:hypothetical protein
MRQRWKKCRASFEASLREAPQDGATFLMPSTTYPQAEERPGAAGARLEARTAADVANSSPASQRLTVTGQPQSGQVAVSERTSGSSASCACSRAINPAWLEGAAHRLARAAPRGLSGFSSSTCHAPAGRAAARVVIAAAQVATEPNKWGIF